jgi:hypothetical protein
VGARPSWVRPRLRDLGTQRLLIEPACSDKELGTRTIEKIDREGDQLRISLAPIDNPIAHSKTPWDGPADGKGKKWHLPPGQMAVVANRPGSPRHPSLRPR